ncbi:MAG: gluconokinase [Candidatus Sulfotelmatobacter sp.]
MLQKRERRNQNAENQSAGIMILLLMGVAGAGKTTVGKLLASQLGWEFADADDYHSVANVEKMRHGIPLTDADRDPWLQALRALISAWLTAHKNAVLACSALKQSYRDTLQVSSEVRIVYLRVSSQVLQQRLRERHGHFMTEAMLQSQLAALEEPTGAVTIDADAIAAAIVVEIRAKLRVIR